MFIRNIRISLLCLNFKTWLMYVLNVCLYCSILHLIKFEPKDKNAPIPLYSDFHMKISFPYWNIWLEVILWSSH